MLLYAYFIICFLVNVLTKQFFDHWHVLLEHSARIFQPDRTGFAFSHDQCPMPCLRSCRRRRVFERKRVSTWSSARVRLCSKPPCLRTLLAHCHRSSNLLSHKNFHFSRADSVFNNPYPPSFWYPHPGGLPSAAKVSMFCLAIKIVSPSTLRLTAEERYDSRIL